MLELCMYVTTRLQVQIHVITLVALVLTRTGNRTSVFADNVWRFSGTRPSFWPVNPRPHLQAEVGWMPLGHDTQGISQPASIDILHMVTCMIMHAVFVCRCHARMSAD
jgi:hypothetical protein